MALAALAVGAVATTSASDVDAQPKKGWKKPGGKKPGKPEAEEPKTEAKAGEEAKAEAKEGEPKGSKAEGAGTDKVQKTASSSGGGPQVVDTKSEGDGGVKTYKFGPVEVEGRLKSPQVVYFLRRVRAEFAAGALGHRSFLRELSDTRRNGALK